MEKINQLDYEIKFAGPNNHTANADDYIISIAGIGVLTFTYNRETHTYMNVYSVLDQKKHQTIEVDPEEAYDILIRNVDSSFLLSLKYKYNEKHMPSDCSYEKIKYKKEKNICQTPCPHKNKSGFVTEGPSVASVHCIGECSHFRGADENEVLCSYKADKKGKGKDEDKR